MKGTVVKAEEFLGKLQLTVKVRDGLHQGTYTVTMAMTSANAFPVGQPVQLVLEPI